MNLETHLTFDGHGNVFGESLTLDHVRQRAPAVFAPTAHESRSSKYTFIPTERVLAGLMDVGFLPIEARQAHTRVASPLHARHAIRLRRRYESISLKDAIPEIIFLNSHDGTSAYQLRMGIYRAVCTNGLIVSRGAFPAVCVAHRGNVVDAVIAGALQMAERFESLAAQVEQMEQRFMAEEEQLTFAARALALRYPDQTQQGMHPSQLLQCRRTEDQGDDLWSTLNCVQENVLRGGLSRKTPSGRHTKTRRITSIREDVRINSGLWDLARGILAA